MVQKGGGSLSSGSSARTDVHEVFDIAVESDVLVLLKKIHRSNLDQDVKNDLRDRLFAYKKDHSSDIVDAFKNAGFSISSGESLEQSQVKKQEKQNEPVTFGHKRSTPSFGSVTPKKVTLKVKSDVPSESQPTEEEKTTTSEPENNIQPASTEKQNEIKQPEAEIQKEKTETPKPDVKPAERIKEIKKEVNKLAGNPVSLVDTNSEVGREYMNALLSAMKSINGGSAEEVTSAMSRLEKVFVSVQKIFSETGSQTDGGATVTENTEEKVVAEPAPTEAQKQGITESQQTNLVKEVEQTEKKEPSETHTQSTNEAQAVDSDAVDVAETTFTPEAVLEKENEEVAPQKTEAAESVTKVAQEDASDGSGIMSVAKEKQLQKLMQKNRVKEVEDTKKKEEETRKTMDPLMTPEVSAGLDQLLSEWSLFKNSGFLGTGPAGIDHPLYKKIAHLTMAAVIAGRFEGATGQVKQSITDYMNGWRYEEGIVHEHAETFEHYLRRVIAHILSGSKKAEAVD